MLTLPQIKTIAETLSTSGISNKEEQAHLLGYALGLLAPLGLNPSEPDDRIEWNSFFNDVPGQVNEHYVLNLNAVQDVAMLTLKYRQAVSAGDEKIGELAKSFLTMTGSAFGLLGQDGAVKRIIDVLQSQAGERIEQLASRNERDARNNEEENKRR